MKILVEAASGRYGGTLGDDQEGGGGPGPSPAGSSSTRIPANPASSRILVHVLLQHPPAQGGALAVRGPRRYVGRRDVRLRGLPGQVVRERGEDQTSAGPERGGGGRQQRAGSVKSSAPKTL